MADANLIVTVDVTKIGGAVTRQGFGTPLGVFQVTTAIQSERFKLYASTAEMTTAGFAATDNAFLWAQVIFSQKPNAPNLVAIGRRVPGTAQVDTVTITTPDVPGSTWSVTINTVVFSYIEATGDTANDIAVGLQAAVAAGDEPVRVGTVAGGIFTVTANVAGDAFVNGGIVVPGVGAGTFVNTVANVAAEAMATALAAIEAENAVDWYLMNIEDRDDTDITAAALFISTRSKVGIWQTRDPDILTDTSPNIGTVLAATNDTRSMLIWHDDETEYADAAMTGIAAAADLDAAGGVITWHGKQFTNAPAQDLTASQIVNIAGTGQVASANGANVQVTLAGRGALIYGRSVEGEFMDVQTTLDWLQFRIEEAILAIILTTPTKVPFTAAGIARIRSAVFGVLTVGVTNGHLAPNTDATPLNVTVPALGDISTADKNNRILRNVQGIATLAGAIHQVDIDISVSA
jgi:hypothetical protein